MNYNLTAFKLDQAAFSAKAIGQISKNETFNLDEAYAIQSISVMQRYARGERPMGLKMGFTSEAKMEQMGVKDQIWGRLTDKMQIMNGGELKASDCIHPRAEPEIAFRLAKDIIDFITFEEAASYIDGVAIAIEIIDSRFENFKFSLEDVVADNCSSSAFVLGDWYPPQTEVSNVTLDLLADGVSEVKGTSKAILGHPYKALEAAVRLSLHHGEPLKKGTIILAGAATSAIAIVKGQQIAVKSDSMGEVSFKVV